MPVKPMSTAQRVVLQYIDGPGSFPGYCELQAATSLTSYKAVDWVLSALERRGYIRDGSDGYELTDAGREARATR